MSATTVSSVECIYVVEIENDYGRYSVALPESEAKTRSNKEAVKGDLSDYFHSICCPCGKE